MVYNIIPCTVPYVYYGQEVLSFYREHGILIVFRSPFDDFSYFFLTLFDQYLRKRPVIIDSCTIIMTSLIDTTIVY